IGEGADPIEGDRAVGDFSCEVPDRGCFVARESHRAKSRRAERQHGLWGKVPIEERDEPAMDGGRRRAGQLLVENALRKSRKVISSRPGQTKRPSPRSEERRVGKECRAE